MGVQVSFAGKSKATSLLMSVIVPVVSVIVKVAVPSPVLAPLIIALSPEQISVVFEMMLASAGQIISAGQL